MLLEPFPAVVVACEQDGVSYIDVVAVVIGMERVVVVTFPLCSCQRSHWLVPRCNEQW